MKLVLDIIKLVLGDIKLVFRHNKTSFKHHKISFKRRKVGFRCPTISFITIKLVLAVIGNSFNFNNSNRKELNNVERSGTKSIGSFEPVKQETR